MVTGISWHWSFHSQITPVREIVKNCQSENGMHRKTSTPYIISMLPNAKMRSGCASATADLIPVNRSTEAICGSFFSLLRQHVASSSDGIILDRSALSLAGHASAKRPVTQRSLTTAPN
jgi:hypothetical protein